MRKLWLRFKTWRFRRRYPNAETLTDESRHCFAVANSIARDAGCGYIHSYHLLAAILHETEAGRVIDPDGALEKAVRKAIGEADGLLKEPIKEALEGAINEARAAERREVSPGDLLVGLATMGELDAHRFLRERGWSVEPLREVIRRKLA